MNDYEATVRSMLHSARTLAEAVLASKQNVGINLTSIAHRLLRQLAESPLDPVRASGAPQDEYKPAAKRLRDRCQCNIFTVTDIEPSVAKTIVRQLLSALEHAERLIVRQNPLFDLASASPSDDGARQPSQEWTALDGSLTIRFLQYINAKRAIRWHENGGIKSWSALEWAGAMAGEAGEACNAAKKLKRIEDRIANINLEEGRSLTDEQNASAQVVDEIADTVIYGVLLAERVGLDLEEAIRMKFNRKSEEYGFPERIPPNQAPAAASDDGAAVPSSSAPLRRSTRPDFPIAADYGTEGVPSSSTPNIKTTTIAAACATHGPFDPRGETCPQCLQERSLKRLAVPSPPAQEEETSAIRSLIRRWRENGGRLIMLKYAANELEATIEECEPAVSSPSVADRPTLETVLNELDEAIGLLPRYGISVGTGIQGGCVRLHDVLLLVRQASAPSASTGAEREQ